MHSSVLSIVKPLHSTEKSTSLLVRSHHHPKKSRQQGAELFLDPNRVYGSYQEMAEKEIQLPEGERIDFVSIVTPNHVHFDVAKTFIEAGVPRRLW